jgi:hypothetical protein
MDRTSDTDRKEETCIWDFCDKARRKENVRKTMTEMG